MTDELLESRYHVGGMDCASCATKIETAVSCLPGVNTVTTSYTSETLRVQHTSTLARSSIERQVKALGYTIASTDKPSGEANDDDHFELGGGPWWKTRKAILTWACGLALVAAYLIGQMLPEIGHWAFSAALLVGLVPIGRRAISGAMHGTPFSIETLMSIAAIGAVFIGATEEAATVVLLFLVGELLEGPVAIAPTPTTQETSVVSESDRCQLNHRE